MRRRCPAGARRPWRRTARCLLARGADHAHARDLVERPRRVGQQLALVRGDGVQPEALDVVDGGTQADDAGDVGRAGLELVRDLVPGRPLEADRARSCRRRPGRAASPRAARPCRRARRRRSGRRACGRRRRRSRQSSACTSTGRCGTACAPSTSTGTPRAWASATMLVHRVDRAQRVGDLGHGDQPRASAEQLARTRRASSSPRVVDRRDHAPCAPVASPSICQGTMLEWCSISVTRISSPGCSVRRGRSSAPPG